MRGYLPIIAVALISACDIVPQRVAMDDPRIAPLLAAAASFDRVKYGFTPLPSTADVRWERRPTKTYDAMLHIVGRTARTIAFRRTEHGFRWTGEQESFEGPKQYTTVDGTFNEQIVLTYEIEHISGAPLNQLWIDYSGPDPRLKDRRDLKLSDVQPILKEWKYL